MKNENKRMNSVKGRKKLGPNVPFLRYCYHRNRRDPAWNTKLDPQVYLDYADALIQWSETENAMLLTEFPNACQVPHSTWKYWLTKSDVLKEAWEYARGQIGARRERMALEGKLNPRVAMRTMPFFDTDLNEFEISRERRIRQDDKQEGNTTYVVLEKYPSSPDVPQQGSSGERSDNTE